MLRSAIMVSLLVVSTRAESSCTKPEDVMKIDFNGNTNPAIGMEWTDAAGQVHTSDINMIPPMATDTTGGAFPGGSVRWKNVGVDAGVAFDILVTAREDDTQFLDETIEILYQNPTSSSSTQAALVTSGGYACLGTSLSSRSVLMRMGIP